ncbi:DNA replication/repair protein RecF [Alicyclobacillus sp. SO9]|uniref:DNA replication/repair protein RecF n=1 Tax=Alicyclobacillus sp. SO9 TaxID=2665646 RepID=UPI0018E90348|nr:DNA replication/repair protein RecF [Alicyclobacillus sp. SO9]QQE78958.1 DNA replication/repair protein RecF [Alicyclobacillus sp. SO9]
MHITAIRLHHFRNYTDESLELNPHVNILLGDNAQGKTNVLEAIYLLAVGKSHRTAKDQDLIHWGEQYSSVEAAIERRGRKQTMAVHLGNKGKRALLNGITQTKMTDFVGHFQVVLFAPEDLYLVKGGPAQRRRFIDMELGQIQVKYLYHLSQYHRVLQQRNSMLKLPNPDLELVDVLNTQLAEHGAQVMYRRRAFVTDLGEFAQGVYHSISSGKEAFSLSYSCSVPGVRWEVSQSVEELEALFNQALIDKQSTDLNQGYTGIGPHRDDLVFKLDNQPVQSFASQGQQRTIALSLRLAEIDFIHREVQEYPVLLLDDVLSELDDERQRNLVLSMREKVQTIITTTSLYHLQSQLDNDAHLLRVRSGIIETEG